MNSHSHIRISRMLQLSSEESDVMTEPELTHLAECQQCRELLHAFLSDIGRSDSQTAN